MDFKPGDRLLIKCSPRQVRVKWVAGQEVMVEWPWRAVDAASKYRWDGTVAVPCDPSMLEWFQTPWRLEPCVGLQSGDSCCLSIPPTEAIMRAVLHYDPPQDLGWLPRPSAAAFMVAAGESEDIEDAGFVIYFDHAEPIEIVPLVN